MGEMTAEQFRARLKLLGSASADAMVLAATLAKQNQSLLAPDVYPDLYLDEVRVLLDKAENQTDVERELLVRMAAYCLLAVAVR